MKSSCPRGSIRRKGYHRKTKSGKIVHVKSNCIKSTRPPGYRGEKRSAWARKVLAGRRKSSGIARKRFGTPKCKPGEIVKSGYVRKAYMRKGRVSVKRAVVPATCVKDLGAKGKGEAKVGPLQHGTLGKYGYVNVLQKSEGQRHDALKKAVYAYGALPVFRKLNAIYILTKRTHVNISHIFKKDRDWVKTEYAV